MTDVIGRGVIEIAADARKLRAGIAEAKKSLATLGESQKGVSAAASRSIDSYIQKLQVQNATFGKSARETEIFKLALRGASDQQLRMADSALKFREAQERSSKTMEFFNVRNLTAGAGLLVVAQATVSTIDAYTKYTAQIRLASDSQADYRKSLADVRNIATAAQAPIAAVGTLFARVSNATRELGIGQKGVADIVETVTLSLKASGATAPEAASAMLQLSQSFGAGALRGEEFNAVSEAAPRLLKALADGLGVPQGALKEMATQGQLTSEVLARTLPKALAEIRKEAEQVQTISGAFTVLQNRVTEFLGAQAEMSNTTKAVGTAMRVLAENLDFVAAAIAGLLTYKVAEFFLVTAKSAYTKAAGLLAAANAANAERAATAASIASEVAKQQATAASAAAQVASLNATMQVIAADRARAVSALQAASATLRATESMASLSGTIAANAAATTAYSAALSRLTSLSVLQANITKELAAAEAAHAAATTAATTAQNGKNAAMGAGAAAGGLLSRTLGLLGGPIGAISTVLSLGASAWILWGNNAEAANKKASESTRQSTIEIVGDLEKQNEKLRERIKLAQSGAAGLKIAKLETPQAERLAEVQKKLQETVAAANASPEGMTPARFAVVRALSEEYTRLNSVISDSIKLKDTWQGILQDRGVESWMKRYATDTEKLNEELAKARKELGDKFTPELERRIREKFLPTKKGSSARDDKTAEREAKALLDFQIDQIKKGSDAAVAEFDRAQKILEASRSANLIDERTYYAERRGFIDLDLKAREDALQKELEILRAQKFAGKDADLERIQNSQKIFDLEQRLTQLRLNAGNERQLLAIQEADSNRKIQLSYEDARASADLYIASVIRRNAAEVSGAGRGEKFRREQEGLLELEAKFIEQRSRLEGERRRNDITREAFDQYLKIATETYQKEVELYKQRVADINEAQSNWLNGALDAIKDYYDETQNIAKQTSNAFSNAFRNAEDALTEFFTTGKTDSKKFIDGIVSDLNRAFTQQNITGPISKALSDGSIISKVGEFFGRGRTGPLPQQDPAPVEQRVVGELTGAAVGKAADSAGFTAAVTAAGTQFTATISGAAATFTPEIIASGANFTTSVTSAAATFLPEIVSAGAQFSAAIVAAGAEFAAAVATSSAAGSGGSGLVSTVASLGDEVLGSFASGVDYIPKTGLYELHRGERVVPASQNMGPSGPAKIEIYQSFAPGTDNKTVAQASVETARAVQRELSRGTA